MKKYICTLLCAVLAATLACPAFAVEAPLTPEAAGAILREQGIYQGDGSGDLMLDKGLTRAELAMLLARLDDPEGEFAAYPDSFGYLCGFPDVPNWAKSAVGYCWNRGLVKGYDNGLFGASDPVIPAAACTVVLRLYGHRAEEGTKWTYATACTYAVSLGLIGETAVQGATINRGDMAVLLCNAMDGKAEPQTSVVPLQPSQVDDYAAQANPAVFTGAYTRKMYNALRYAVLHQEETNAGTYQPVSLGAEVDTDTALQLTSRMGNGTIRYSIVDAIDGSAVYLYANHNEEYDAAVAHVEPFLENISPLSQREQVREMVWYIADRMTYDVKIKALPAQILAQDEIMEGAGNCMTYSYSLWFLCGQAGIPCILLDSFNHQWNMVYVDGEWWHVDPTANKENIQTMSFQEAVNGTLVEVEKTEAERVAILQSTRASLPVFYRVIGETSYIDGSVRIDPTYVDEQPERTKFLQELAVPGSTK